MRTTSVISLKYNYKNHCFISLEYFFMEKDFEPLKTRLREINKFLDLEVYDL